MQKLCNIFHTKEKKNKHSPQDLNLHQSTNMTSQNIVAQLFAQIYQKVGTDLIGKIIAEVLNCTAFCTNLPKSR